MGEQVRPRAGQDISGLIPKRLGEALRAKSLAIRLTTHLG